MNESQESPITRMPKDAVVFEIRKIMVDGYTAGDKYDIRVVRWGVDTTRPFVLEKRRVYEKFAKGDRKHIKGTGTKYYGSSAGFNLAEFEFIIANQNEIRELLK